MLSNLRYQAKRQRDFRSRPGQGLWLKVYYDSDAARQALWHIYGESAILISNFTMIFAVNL